MKDNLANIVMQSKDELINDTENLKENISCVVKDKMKLVFFVRLGLDSFLGDIIEGLSQEYEIKKIIATEYKQIEDGMQWADICWFEWCDELIAYGSKLELAREKKVICRLHRYEALTEYPMNVMWENVDKLIIVADHLKKFLVSLIPDIETKVEIVTLANGLNLSKYKLKERNKGFNIAYVGYIHSRKNPVLLFQIMNALVKKDKRYKLYVAGQFQDPLIQLYWNDAVNKMGLEKNIIFQGWQEDVNIWLEDKNYILSTSIHESFGYGIAEAMARGIKPIIYNFLFAEEIWDDKFMFNTIDEAVEMISDKNYNSKVYRSFIKDRYSLNNQLIKIKDLLISLPEKRFKENLSFNYIIGMFNRFIPYSSKDLDNYDFEACQMVIGKREKIGDNINLIEFIIRNKFGKQVVFNNILYDIERGKVILPDYILRSKNSDKIIELLNILIDLKVKLLSNIEGYIFDEEILEDIKKNQLAYIWERGIPASQFMPALGWLRIIERYNFAANFIKSSDLILEAASGFGYGAAYFHDKCKKVYALDLAKENIKFGEDSYDFDNISWITGDVTKLPFEDNQFDIYTSFETLEHLSLDLVEAYFNEAVRVLNENGIMILSTPNKEGRKNINNPFHVKEYNFSEFNKILKMYFSNVNYYSTTNYKIENGIKSNAVNMIAVCSNRSIKINPDDLSKSSDKVDLMKIKFMVNSDDITNTEALFDYLLSVNDEESYMKYLSEWFIRSKYELTFKFNYYYGNMYRRFTNYSRFKYMQENVYNEMDKIGQKILEENYLTYFSNKSISLKENERKILFILNGLDIHQSVTQFFINYLESSENAKDRYSVLSLLNKNEFNNSKESIEYFNNLNVNLLVPISNSIEDKIKEFYTYISEENFDYVVYQSLYFAPIGILLYPLLKKVCKIIGKIQFQQPEDYFDKKLDFCYTYIKKDNCCENIFELISPINTELVDKNLDIRTLFNIDRKKKVVISIGRSIKYKNNEFWNFAIKLINEIDDICLVVFGGNYSEFEQYVPNKLIQECNVIFAGFNLEASSYLKSCDFYLNSYPGGGYSLEEAYYAELPIITFYKDENDEAFDAMNASYMASAYLYNDAKTIFPKAGDFDKLLNYSKKLIKDNSFRNTIKMNRKIESSNLKFEYFVKEFEKYMDNIANNNGRNNK